MIGVSVPIEPVRRHQFHYVTRERIEPIPAMRRMGAPGVHRHQDGYTNPEQPTGFNWDVEHAKFEEVLWPQLAVRGLRGDQADGRLRRPLRAEPAGRRAIAWGMPGVFG